jgi:hypothetical protein
MSLLSQFVNEIELIYSLDERHYWFREFVLAIHKDNTSLEEAYNTALELDYTIFGLVDNRIIEIFSYWTSVSNYNTLVNMLMLWDAIETLDVVDKLGLLIQEHSSLTSVQAKGVLHLRIKEIMLALLKYVYNRLVEDFKNIILDVYTSKLFLINSF